MSMVVNSSQVDAQLCRITGSITSEAYTEIIRAPKRSVIAQKTELRSYSRESRTILMIEVRASHRIHFDTVATCRDCAITSRFVNRRITKPTDRNAIISVTSFKRGHQKRHQRNIFSVIIPFE